MVLGTKNKQQYHTSYPPFSVFSSFIHKEVRMRKYPTFITPSSSIAPPKGERFSTKTVRTPITVHRIEADNTPLKDETKGLDNPKKQVSYANVAKTLDSASKRGNGATEENRLPGVL